jgi:hypothetical protein
MPECSGFDYMKESFNGKTGFQLAKALTKSGKVFYNTLEEGARKSMQKMPSSPAEHAGSEKPDFTIGNREGIDDLKDRLRRKNTDIIFTPLQYTD